MYSVKNLMVRNKSKNSQGKNKKTKETEIIDYNIDEFSCLVGNFRFSFYPPLNDINKLMLIWLKMKGNCDELKVYV